METSALTWKRFVLHIYNYPANLSHFLSFLLSLRPLDVEFMRRLSKVVNIVPVIAKADTLTLEERDFFKKKVDSASLNLLALLLLKCFMLSKWLLVT